MLHRSFTVTAASGGLSAFAIDKLLPATFATKVEGLAFFLSGEGGRFVDFHMTNWIDRHDFPVDQKQIEVSRDRFCYNSAIEVPPRLPPL